MVLGQTLASGSQKCRFLLIFNLFGAITLKFRNLMQNSGISDFCSKSRNFALNGLKKILTVEKVISYPQLKGFAKKSCLAASTSIFGFFFDYPQIPPDSWLRQLPSQLWLAVPCHYTYGSAMICLFNYDNRLWTYIAKSI